MSNFDTVFTAEAPLDSVVEGSQLSQTVQDQFAGAFFTKVTRDNHAPDAGAWQQASRMMARTCPSALRELACMCWLCRPCSRLRVQFIYNAFDTTILPAAAKCSLAFVTPYMHLISFVLHPLSFILQSPLFWLVHARRSLSHASSHPHRCCTSHSQQYLEWNTYITVAAAVRDSKRARFRPNFCTTRLSPCIDGA